MCMSPRAVGVEPDGVPLGRFLPLALGVTAAVTALPLLAVSQLGPARSVPALALHVIAAVALSVLLARLLAALWKRHRQSSDLVFGDLLIWGWTRRALAERRLEAATREIEAPAAGDESRVALLRRMNSLLEARDPYTHGHSRRVARHAERIAREIGLPVEQVEKIRAAALVHDIGKVNVPRSILNKPDQLTDDEYSLVKRHAADGAVLVSALDDPGLTAIVRHHHERMDGTGYPDGLAGGDIPIGARVIAVADTFDAITSTRAYRKPRTHKPGAPDIATGGGHPARRHRGGRVRELLRRAPLGRAREHARRSAAAPADGARRGSVRSGGRGRAAGADGVRRRRRCADRRLPRRAGAAGLHHLRGAQGRPSPVRRAVEPQRRLRPTHRREPARRRGLASAGPGGGAAWRP